MKAMVTVMLVAAGLGTQLQATVIDTWTGGVSYYGSYFNQVSPPFGQTFVVPENTTATQFEFYVDKGSGTSSSMAVAIWDVSGNVMSVVSTDRSDPLWGGTTQGWVPGIATGTTLNPGTYHAAIWSNNGDVNIDIYLFRSTTSTYSDGYAYRGYESGDPIGENNDFMARLTVVPEPLTLGLLAVGGLFLRRNKK